MAEIKNIHLIEDEEIKEKLEHAALMHRRYSSIFFKIKSNTPDKMEVQVRQEKALSNNYATKERLIEIGIETFGQHFGNKKLYMHAMPYKAPAIDIVTPEWVDDQIRELGVKGRHVAKDLDLSPSELSAYINGHRNLSKRAKAMFYYYFKYISTNQKS